MSNCQSLDLDGLLISLMRMLFYWLIVISDITICNRWGWDCDFCLSLRSAGTSHKQYASDGGYLSTFGVELQCCTGFDEFRLEPI